MTLPTNAELIARVRRHEEEGSRYLLAVHLADALEAAELTIKELETIRGRCAFCGFRCPDATVFAEHVLTCDKHPLAIAMKRIAELEAEDVEVICPRCSILRKRGILNCDLCGADFLKVDFGRIKARRVPKS